MNLDGIHLLLTYQCVYECDHCFVWGSPRQTGTMTLAKIRRIFRQAQTLGTVRWIYFEGGEPTLYHPLLVRAVVEAGQLGFQVGVVSNAYWANTEEDAREWLRPLAGQVQDLSLSRDLYHDDATSGWARVERATAAARALGMIPDVLSVAQPDQAGGPAAAGQLPPGESAVMYRGRAAVKLAGKAAPRPWQELTTCPHEDLREPGRVHVDAFGHLHVCQGIVAGNLFERPLRDLCAAYDPDAHPIAGPLLAGGPAELVRRYDVPHAGAYADACHLCFEARAALRGRFPDVLTPDQMYGSP